MSKLFPTVVWNIKAPETAITTTYAGQVGLAGRGCPTEACRDTVLALLL